MDKEKDKGKIQEEKMKLMNEAQNAEKTIKRITEENYDSGMRALQSRRSELQDLVEKCIPALPPNQKMMIEQKAKDMTQVKVAPAADKVSLDDF